MVKAVKCYAALQGDFSVLSIVSRSLIDKQIISIGDCSRGETKSFFFDHLLPDVPESLKPGLRDQFDDLYKALGGKLAHWSDFVREYVSKRGKLIGAQTTCPHR